MSSIHSIILGLIQGLTEFLPISSSGHLIILPWLLGWKEHPLMFDVMLHFATFFAIITYFRKDWINILRDGFLSIREKGPGGPNQRNLLWYIIIASIPAVIFGSIVGERADYYFRNPIVVALMLGTFGIILYISELHNKKRKPLKDITWQIFLLIGLAQVFAIIPGVSRAGVTISAAMALGINRESSVRFSFLMGAPIIFAAACYSIGGFLIQHIGAGESLQIGGIISWQVLLAGFLTSFASSVIAIHFLLRYIRRHPFTTFVIYRLIASVAIVTIFYWRG